MGMVVIVVMIVVVIVAVIVAVIVVAIVAEDVVVIVAVVVMGGGCVLSMLKEALYCAGPRGVVLHLVHFVVDKVGGRGGYGDPWCHRLGPSHNLATFFEILIWVRQHQVWLARLAGQHRHKTRHAHAWWTISKYRWQAIW